MLDIIVLIYYTSGALKKINQILQNFRNHIFHCEMKSVMGLEHQSAFIWFSICALSRIYEQIKMGTNYDKFNFNTQLKKLSTFIREKLQFHSKVYIVFN